MTLSKSDIETDILSELKDKKESINQIFTTKDTQQDIAKINNEIIEQKIYPTHYEINDALFWIEDILGRGLIDWVLVGDIADQLRKYNDPTLLADKIEIQILRKKFTQSGRSMISTWIPEATDESLNQIKINYKKIPIYITIIDEDPGYLQNPDNRFFYVTEFKIPNPYEVYLNVRNNNN